MGYVMVTMSADLWSQESLDLIGLHSYIMPYLHHLLTKQTITNDCACYRHLQFKNTIKLIKCCTQNSYIAVYCCIAICCIAGFRILVHFNTKRRLWLWSKWPLLILWKQINDLNVSASKLRKVDVWSKCMIRDPTQRDHIPWSFFIYAHICLRFWLQYLVKTSNLRRCILSSQVTDIPYNEKRARYDWDKITGSCVSGHNRANAKFMEGRYCSLEIRKLKKTNSY